MGEWKLSTVANERTRSHPRGNEKTMAAQIEQTPTQLPSATSAAPPLQNGASHGSRMLFIDNLRILLISMVLVVHLDDTYGGIGSWYYHDPATNLLTGVLLTIPNA